MDLQSSMEGEIRNCMLESMQGTVTFLEGVRNTSDRGARAGRSQGTTRHPSHCR